MISEEHQKTVKKVKPIKQNKLFDSISLKDLDD